MKKRVIYGRYQISDSRDREKTDKRRSVIKKWSSTILGVKMGFFSKNNHSKILVRENVFPSPPNSAPSLRLNNGCKS